jgi:hypothetical protein
MASFPSAAPPIKINMGQAKRRGTFEERLKSAIERQSIDQPVDASVRKTVLQLRFLKFMSVMAALTTSIPYDPKYRNSSDFK